MKFNRCAYYKLFAAAGYQTVADWSWTNVWMIKHQNTKKQVKIKVFSEITLKIAVTVLFATTEVHMLWITNIYS